MKKIILASLAVLFGMHLLQAQQLKVVEGSEVFVETTMGKTKAFEINLKNTSGKKIDILGIENIHHEINVEALEDKVLLARETKTLHMEVTPDAYGVHKLKLMVKYAIGRQRNTISFVVKIDAQ